jgi:hypothetical protein
LSPRLSLKVRPLFVRNEHDIVETRIFRLAASVEHRLGRWMALRAGYLFSRVDERSSLPEPPDFLRLATSRNIFLVSLKFSRFRR